jgi:hypothetical protein
MSKRERPSLARFANAVLNPAAASEPEERAEAESPQPSSKGEATTPAPALPAVQRLASVQGPPRAAKRQRVSRSHTTIYLPPQVIRRLKEIALTYDCKPHDLLLEGVDMMLEKYGQPSVAEMSRDGTP